MGPRRAGFSPEARYVRGQTGTNEVKPRHLASAQHRAGPAGQAPERCQSSAAALWCAPARALRGPSRLKEEQESN